MTNSSISLAVQDTPVLVDRRGAVLWIRMNRPHVRNALDRPMGYGLIEALNQAERDEVVRAVVVTGVGRAFCAGDDIQGLKAILTGDEDDPAAPTDPHDGASLYLRVAAMIRKCPKPVVTAANGYAFGAGFEMFCAGDVRCMSGTAKLGSHLIHIAEAGNFALLSAIIGADRAFEIFLSGRSVEAVEAKALGLVHEVWTEDTFTAELSALAERIALLPTKIVGLQKRLRNESEGRTLLDRVRLQDEIHRACVTLSEDAREGAAAFLEKRAPIFTGR